MHRNPTVPRTQHSQNSLGEGAAHNSPRDSPIREPGTQDREVPTPNAAVLISRLLQWGWSPTQSQVSQNVTLIWVRVAGSRVSYCRALLLFLFFYF